MHCCLRTRSACASCCFVTKIVAFLLLSGLSIGLTPGRLSAAEKSLEASTSQAARADAVAAIPLARVSSQHRETVREILDDTTVFRRLPTQIVKCDPAMFTFMAKNPEVLVEIWRELGITKVSLERIDATSFRMADNAGTTGKLTIVEQACEENAQNRIVMVAEGAYEGKPFAQPVKAQCVLLLRSGSFVESDGQHYVAARLDSFIRLDKASWELFAKVVHPLVGKMADRNFADTITFVGNFSQAAELEPARIKRLADNLDNVSAARQRELGKIAYDCHKNASPAEIARTARTVH